MAEKIIKKESESVKERKKALLFVLIAVVLTFLTIFTLYIVKEGEKDKTLFKSAMYGIWVEKDVVNYAADIFELSPSGVRYNQKMTATKFELSNGFDKGLSFYITYNEEMKCTFFKNELKCKNPLTHYEQVYEKSSAGYVVKKRS